MSTSIHCDVVIIGAGAIGSAVASEISQTSRAPKVIVVDRDLEGTLSSSELNAGGVRATWQQPINIACSKLSIEYFSKHAHDVGYRACGYLWLCDRPKFESGLKAQKLQTSMGWEVQAWDVAHIKKQIPFIDKTDDLVGAIFGPRDGLINPNLLKQHFRARAKSAGVQFLDRHEFFSAARIGDDWSLSFNEVVKEINSDELLSLYGEPSRKSVKPKILGEVKITAKYVINCAGAWAPQVAKTLGYNCPSYAVRRQISLFDCRSVDLSPYGMIIDKSGVYFHPEATNGLAGIAQGDEPHGINFEYGGETFFTEQIWANLYERSSAFAELKHISGWAGQYEVSPDESAILGQVADTSLPGLYEAHSFSGHGVMHAYAAGLGLAELIMGGRYETLDLSPLSASRFKNGKLIREGLVI